MPGTQHCVCVYFCIYDTLFACFEEGLKEVVVLDSNDGRHQNVHLMAMNLKSVVSKKLRDTVVCLHNLCLRIFISWYYNNSSIFCKHHLKIIQVLVMCVDISIAALFLASYRFRSLHHLGLSNKVLPFSSVILDLHQIIPVDLQCFWVIVVYSGQLSPYLIYSFCVIDDV